MVGEYFPWAFHTNHPAPASGCDTDSDASCITRSVSGASSMSTGSEGGEGDLSTPQSHFIYTQVSNLACNYLWLCRAATSHGHTSLRMAHLLLQQLRLLPGFRPHHLSLFDDASPLCGLPACRPTTSQCWASVHTPSSTEHSCTA